MTDQYIGNTNAFKGPLAIVFIPILLMLVVFLFNLLNEKYMKKSFAESLDKPRSLTAYETFLVNTHAESPLASDVTLDGYYQSLSMSTPYKSSTATWHFDANGTFSHEINNTVNEYLPDLLQVRGRYEIKNSAVYFTEMEGWLGLIPPALGLEVVASTEGRSTLTFLMPSQRYLLLQQEK